MCVCVRFASPPTTRFLPPTFSIPRERASLILLPLFSSGWSPRSLSILLSVMVSATSPYPLIHVPCLVKRLTRNWLSVASLLTSPFSLLVLAMRSCRACLCLTSCVCAQCLFGLFYSSLLTLHKTIQSTITHQPMSARATSPAMRSRSRRRSETSSLKEVCMLRRGRFLAVVLGLQCSFVHCVGVALVNPLLRL